MLLAHAEPAAGGAWPYAIGLGVGYLALALRRRHDPRGWSAWRTAAFLAGSLVLAVGLTPQLLPFPDGDFRGHVLQHLLIGMVAPLGLVLGAPVTLVLRSVTTRQGRSISRVLRSRPLHVVTDPVVALVLNVGGMVVLYTTPLYRLTTADPVVHQLVHLHFLAAGCLFAWVVAGPDPAPRRPSVPARLVVLGVAVAVHSTVAQLLYAGLLTDVGVTTDELRGGATLMYYGGDIAELLLAFALVSTWRPAVVGGGGVAAGRGRSRAPRRHRADDGAAQRIAYLIATACGGDPTPPRRLRGTDTSRNSCTPSAAQSAASASSTHISPMGMPSSGSRCSWRKNS